MLTDADRLLLAAAVDGPLAPDEVAALGRLVSASAAARDLLDRLHADRRALQALPRLTAPSDFGALVLDRAYPTHVTARGRGAWPTRLWPYALAGGLLVAVGVAGWQTAPGPTRPAVAKVAPKSAPLVAPGPGPERLPPPRPAPEPPAVAVVEPARPTPERLPAPRPAAPLAAAGLFAEIAPAVEAVARLPVLVAVAELRSPAVQGRVVDELAAVGVALLDLFSPDPAAAVPHVVRAAEACGLAVHADAAARERLRLKQPGAFVLFTEGLTPADAAGFLAGLSDRQRDGAPLLTAHLAAAGPAELRDLKELLADVRRAPRDPVAEATVDRVVRSVAGGRRPAVLFAPPVSAGRARELRADLDARGERKPGAVPLLVVVRPADAGN